MPSGRTQDIADRNREIKIARADGLSAELIGEIWGIPRTKVYKILGDPTSHHPTVRTAKILVRPLEDHEDDGISHGSTSGYRVCLRRPQGACDDCKEANALAQRTYQARVRATLR